MGLAAVCLLACLRAPLPPSNGQWVSDVTLEEAESVRSWAACRLSHTCHLLHLIQKALGGPDSIENATVKQWSRMEVCALCPDGGLPASECHPSAPPLPSSPSLPSLPSSPSAPPPILSAPPLIPLPSPSSLCPSPHPVLPPPHPSALPLSCPPSPRPFHASPYPVHPSPHPVRPPQGCTKLLQLLFGGGSSVLFGNSEVRFDRKESFLVCDDGLLQLEGAWSQVPSHSDLSGVDKSEWKHRVKLL